jgi:GNAT superfamily N-acetyltransferase
MQLVLPNTVSDENGREFEFIVNTTTSDEIEMIYKGKKVGQAQVLYWLENQFWFEVEIHKFSINEQYRRQGFGTALGKFLCDYAKQTNIKIIFTEISVHNIVAREFARKMGFSALDDEPDYWEYKL